MLAQLDHEKLDVYQVALDFVVTASEIIDRLPKGSSYIVDHLQRASLSVPLNIAEGAGEFSEKEKIRFYRIARRSATECSAILDVCRRLGLVEDSQIEEGRGLLVRLVAMLVRLARKKQ